MTKEKPDLSPDFLRSVLDYDAQTGVFKWRYREDHPQKWNTRFAGKAAGSLSNGYIWIRLFKKNGLYAAHRLVWLYVHGCWPVEHIDHINRQRDDNRLANLRECTRSENLRNRPKQSNNTSGYAGVRFREHHGKWEARITVEKRAVWHAYFDSAQEAAAARRKELAKYHGEFAHKGG